MASKPLGSAVFCGAFGGVVAETEGRIGRRGLRRPLQQVEEAEDFLVADAGRGHQLVERQRQEVAQVTIEKGNGEAPIGRQYPVRKSFVETTVVRMLE